MRLRFQAPARSSAVIGDIAAQAGKLGIEICDVSAHVDEVAERVGKQSELCQTLRESAAQTLAGNHRIALAARGMLDVAARTATGVQQSRQTIDASLAEIHALVEGVNTIESQIASLRDALAHVSRVSEEISLIARQTHLLALNAAIEAARAGDSGKSFAVVAAEVKNLSAKTAQATAQIETTLSQLTGQTERLISEGATNTERAHRVREGTHTIGQVVHSTGDAIRQLNDEADEIATLTGEIEMQCTGLETGVTGMASDVEQSAHNFVQARERLAELLGVSETLIELTAETGVRTDDTRFIEAVQATAAKIGKLFETAVARGEITLAELFDTRYELIPGTNPPQYLTRFTALTDRLLPPLLEPLLELDPRVVFCAAVDPQGYLPTNNRKFSHPQGSAVWNAAHCRNRRLFKDRAGLAVGTHTKPFLLQTYRRDMGGGEFVVMKDASAPIYVGGRHWGGFRIGYRLE